MRNTFRSCFVLGLSLFVLPHAFSQGVDVFAGVPHERAVIDQTLRQHTQRAIAASTYYGLVFRELLLAPARYPGIPEADWAVMRNLPSHRDARFLQQDLASLDGVCQALETVDDKALPTLAARYDSERRQSETRLDAHYAQVLAQLSANTRAEVERKRAAFAANGQVSQMKVHMEGFARDLPAAARAVMQRGCNALGSRQDRGPPPSLLLIDDHPTQIPLTR